MKSGLLLASALLLGPMLYVGEAHAEARACSNVNGVQSCVTGNYSVSCSTVNGTTHCFSDGKEVVPQPSPPSSDGTTAPPGPVVPPNATMNMPGISIDQNGRMRIQMDGMNLSIGD
jgi:hypothetical protein